MNNAEQMEATLTSSLNLFLMGSRLMPVDLRLLLLTQAGNQLAVVTELALALCKREEAR